MQITSSGEFIPTLTQDTTRVATPATGVIASQTSIYRYFKSGRRVQGKLVISVPANGTGGGGYVDITLLHAAAPINSIFHQAVIGVEVGVTGKSLAAYILNNTSTLRVRLGDGTYPLVDNAILSFHLDYETAS